MCTARSEGPADLSLRPWFLVRLKVGVKPRTLLGEEDRTDLISHRGRASFNVDSHYRLLPAAAASDSALWKGMDERLPPS